MTLTICIKAKDGILFASDSRASNVLTSVDTAKKLFRLDDRTGIGIAGDGYIAGHLIDITSGDLKYDEGITRLAEQVHALWKQRFQDYIPDPVGGDSKLEVILAGYNGDQPEIYKLRSWENFAPRKSPTGFECIGVPYIAEYLLTRVYEPVVTIEHAAEMAALCISETHEQNSSVGGALQLASFSNIKPYTTYSEGDSSKIYKKFAGFRLELKNRFFPEDAAAGTSDLKDATRV